MMGDKMKDIPLLSEDDRNAIFKLMWERHSYLNIPATKKNPDRLITIRHFLQIVDSAIHCHVASAAHMAVRRSNK